MVYMYSSATPSGGWAVCRLRCRGGAASSYAFESRHFDAAINPSKLATVKFDLAVQRPATEVVFIRIVSGFPFPQYCCYAQVLLILVVSLGG